MSCNHTMSLSRGVCVHCGMPDPSLSETVESESEGLKSGSLALYGGLRTGKTLMAAQQIKDALDTGKAVLYMSPGGSISFDYRKSHGTSVEFIHKQLRDLADQVLVGGTRREYQMATLPIDHEYTVEAWPDLSEGAKDAGSVSKAPYWDPAWDFTPYIEPPPAVGENFCKEISLQYVEDTLISPSLRQYMRHWSDAIDRQFREVYLDSTLKPNRNGHVYPNVTHELFDVSVVKEPTVSDARLSNAYFTADPDSWNVNKETALVARMIDSGVNALLNRNDFLLNTDRVFHSEKPRCEVTKVYGDPTTLQLFVDIAITPPKIINRRIMLPESFSVGGHSANPLHPGVTDFRIHVGEPGYLKVTDEMKKELEMNGPGAEIVQGRLGTVQGMEFKRGGTLTARVETIMEHPSFMRWWADSVNSASNRFSPGAPVGEVSESYVAPTLPVTGPTADEYRRLLDKLVDRGVPVSQRTLRAAVGINPHGEMDLPREAEPRKVPPFNQESIDWYTAVADQMLDECERDGEDQGTTILRVTNALDRELDTQAKVVRAAYKKVGMFCIDIERGDERLSLVIERKGWWN